MTSWCHVLPVPRLDTHQEDPGNKQHTTSETQDVHVQLTCSESDIYPQPNSPRKPHRAPLSSASLWKIKSLVILMIVQMLDAGFYTDGRRRALTGGPTFPSSPGRPSVPGIPCQNKKNSGFSFFFASTKSKNQF